MRVMMGYPIKIITSDFELDTYLQSFFKEGLQPIINPLFDSKTKEFDSGLVLKNIQDLIEEANAKNIKTWSKDEKVKIVFPDEKSDKHATGILLTDEFMDDTGELCAIFQPIENGKRLDDMQLKLPIKLLVPWD